MIKKILLIISISLVTVFVIFLNKTNIKDNNQDVDDKLVDSIKSHYNTLIKTNKQTSLFDSEDKEIIKVEKNIVLFLDTTEINKKTKKFKIKDYDYYINYKDVEPYFEEYIINDRYLNYFTFEENLKLKNNFKLYKSDELVFTVKESATVEYYKKDNNIFYIKFMNELYELLDSDVEEIIQTKSKETAIEIPIIAYHFIHPDDDKLCNQIICHSVSQVDSHLSYLKENNYFTITTNELELFLDKKIKLPKKSILITIDDGWYAENAIPLLENYQLNATLFLITSWYEKESFTSSYLELASHTNDLHTPYQCPGDQGSPLKCLDYNILLKDLIKSREYLNNTNAFCYPFYEYNQHSEQVVKDAGFTLAFIGGQKKANLNTNKLRIPRITLFNDTSMEEFKKIVKVK